MNKLKSGPSAATLPEIWVLDELGNESPEVELLLGKHHSLQCFRSLDEIKKALSESNKDTNPALILFAEPKIQNQNPTLPTDLLPPHPPVLVLSSCDDPKIITTYLDYGACDYLTKPVNQNLLIVKLQRLLPLKLNPPAGAATGLQFSVTTKIVRNVNGDTVKLTPKEFELLHSLHLAFPEMMTSAQLRKKLWGTVAVSSKAFDVHLFGLRRKLHAIGADVVFGGKGTYVLAMNLPIPKRA